MTAAELIKILEKVPPNMQIFMGERLTEFKYGLVNSAKVKTINMAEEPDGEVLATEKVIILEEE